MRKCKILFLGWNNPRQQYVPRSYHLESRSAVKERGILVDLKVTMSWQCTLAA